MLTELVLKNFKCIAEDTVPLSAVNVIIGLNGSGKSSLIQSLALVKQSLGQLQLQPTGAVLDLGSYEEIVRREAGVGADLKIGIAGVAPLGSPIEIRGQQCSEVAFRKTHTLRDNAPVEVEVSYETQPLQVRARWSRPGVDEIEPRTIEINGSNFNIAFNLGFGMGLEVSSQSKRADVNPAVHEDRLLALRRALKCIDGVVSRMFFVPALRGSERPAYDLGQEPSPEFAGTQGSVYQAQRLVTTLAYRRELEEQVSSWLDRVTGRRIRARLLPPRQVSLEMMAGENAVNVVNEGFGSNQLTYILTQLAVLPEDSLMAIEEPEIHLHPAAQAMLIEVLVTAALAARKQLLMTTHSEHVLYSLMRLVAAGTLKSEEVGLYFMEREDGVCRCRELAIDTHGRVEGGLPGFFEAQLEEFRRYVEAAERSS